MKLQKLFLSFTALATALFMGGCATNQGTYVDSRGPDTLVVGDQITVTDFYIASDEMVNSLVSSGALERSPKQPAILGISRIINDTREQFDTDQLVKKIRVALNQTGKVMTTTTVGYRGNAEDKFAEAINAKKEYLEGKAAVPDATPDFTLSGKIIQTAKVKVGKQRQNSYIFQLSLTEVRSGIAVWEGEETITKQYKKGGVSW